MFLRNLLLLLLAGIAVLYAMRLVRRLQRRGPPRGQHKGGAPEKMVPCAKCGTFVPQSEAIQADQRYYCSRAHALEPPESGR